MRLKSLARRVVPQLFGVRLKCDTAAVLDLDQTVHLGRNVYIHAQDGATIRIAASAYIDEGTRIIACGQSCIEIGPHFRTHPNALIYAAKSGRLRCGREFFLGRAAEVNCTHSITIGDRCGIAAVGHVIDSDHSTEYGQPIAAYDVYGPVVLGVGAWLGAHSVVTRGVTVGDGAVVGAGGVVTRDVPANEIWGGVPAKKIRHRQDVL